MIKNARLGRIAAAVAIVGLTGLVAAGCGQQQAAGTAQAQTNTSTPAPQKVSLNMQIVNGGNAAHSDWPFFSEDGKNPVPANLTLPANAIVTVTIKNADDGNDAVPAQYAKVSGTVGNTITTSTGQTLSSLPGGKASHTFTVPGLNLNVPLPPSSTVTFTFKTPAKAGTYSWQCMVPCGTGSDGWGGPMVAGGWMQGNIVIQ